MEAIATQEEFFKYDAMIKKFYFTNRSIFEHPALSLDLDDVLQEMRVLILKAIPKYDPTKGATLSTYLYMHLGSRLKDLRSKILRKTKYVAGFHEDVLAYNNFDDNSNVDFKMDYLTFKSFEGDFTKQDALVDLIDVKIIMENFRGEDRELFIDRYLGGYSFAELKKRHNRSYTHMNKKFRTIDTIFETLRFQQ